MPTLRARGTALIIDSRQAGTLVSLLVFGRLSVAQQFVSRNAWLSVALAASLPPLSFLNINSTLPLCSFVVLLSFDYSSYNELFYDNMNSCSPPHVSPR